MGTLLLAPTNVVLLHSPVRRLLALHKVLLVEREKRNVASHCAAVVFAALRTITCFQIVPTHPT